MNAKTYELPEQVNYTPLHATTRTHKIGEGRFCAVGALYFGGRRGLYLSCIASSRRQAEAAALYALEHGQQKPLTERGRARDFAWESERFLRAMEA